MRRNIPRLTWVQSEMFPFCLISVFEPAKRQRAKEGKDMELVLYFNKIICNHKYIKVKELLNIVLDVADNF